jgi:hypothetical protein
MLAYSLAIAAIAGVSACGGDSTTDPATPPPASTPVGSYSIATVNGKSLPVATAQSGDYKWEITAGSMALTADGKYSVVTTERQTIPNNVETFVDSTGGSWVQSGTTITLTNGDDGSIWTGTWAGLQLTFATTDGTVTTTFVYSKKG